MKYIRIKTGDIPGVTVTQGGAYCEVAGEYFPITAFVADREFGFVPLLDIPQMSDERLRELAQEHPVRDEVIA